MKIDLVAIYNTLGKLQLPNTPENAKNMAGIYIALERVILEADKLEKEQAETENGGD